MKLLFAFCISMILFNTMVSQGTQFEFSGSDHYFSQHLTVTGDDIYFTFSSESQSIYSTYIAKWNITEEKVQWCRKLTINNGISINPVKIMVRKDGTIILGAYDYSWKDGFANGNYTFLLFDNNGQLLQSKRLGSPTGGVMRDMLVDDDDSIIFIGDRINAQSEYKTLVGRLDKDLNVVKMRSVFKHYYTYGLALQEDKDGNIYTVGHTQQASNGTSRSFVTKWSKDLDHISSIMNLDNDPSSSFNSIYIDDDHQIHLGGSVKNLANYVRLNKNFQFEYGYEFNFGYPRNIWIDQNGHTNIYIDGPNYFVRLDQNNKVQQFLNYGVNGNTTSQTYIPHQDRIYNFSFYNIGNTSKNRLSIASHAYSVDNECFLYDRQADTNKPLSLDSFGVTNVIITDEVMTAIVPDDISVSDYNLDVKEICRIEKSATKEHEEALNLTVFPNPAYDYIILKHDDPMRLTKGEFISMNGRLITIPDSEIQRKTISIVGLDSGIYVLRLTNFDGRQILRKVHIL